MLSKSLNIYKTLQKNSQAGAIKAIYFCMKCISLLNRFNLCIRSNKSTAVSYDKHYFIILYSLHRWSSRCRQKANQFLHCELFSYYCFSISAFEFLTETDGRTCRDLHKTRMSLLSGKSLFLNRVWIWKAPAARQKKMQSQNSIVYS